MKNNGKGKRRKGKKGKKKKPKTRQEKVKNGKENSMAWNSNPFLSTFCHDLEVRIACRRDGL